MAVKDIPWAAGILEGEGCFSMHKRKGKDYYQCAIHCEMTDEDTIISLQKALGAGRVSQRDARGVRKPTWILSIQRQKDIFDTLIRVMPYLGDRRLSKASDMFEYLEEIVCVRN